MKSIIFLTILLHVCVTCFSQSPYSIVITGTRVADHQTIQTSDSGFVVLGSHGSSTLFTTSLLVFKMDRNGNQLWSKSINTFGFTQAIAEADNGDLVIAGTGSSTSDDFVIIRLTRNGELIWAKTMSGAKRDNASSIIKTRDSNFIMMGTSESFPSADQYQHVLIKFDNNGSVIWSRVLPFLQGGPRGHPSLLETKDGDLLLCGGVTSPNSNGIKGVIIRLNSLGETKWMKRGDLPSFIKKIIPTSDGGYAMAGWGNFDAGVTNQPINDAYVGKLDSAGNTLWSKRIGTPRTNLQGGDDSTSIDYGQGIAETKDSGILVSLISTISGAFPDPNLTLLTKFTNDGTFVFSNSMILNGSPDLLGGGSLINASDSGFLLTNSANGQINVHKLDKNGYPCGSVSSQGYAIDAGVFTNQPLTTTAVNITFSPLNLTSVDLGTSAFVCNGALPLKLISFKVTNSGAQNLLTWRTANEINADRFVVERSNNGRDYTIIGTTNAGLNQYAFSDVKPIKGINYYRLKMIDNDGSFAYSVVRMIDNNKNNFSVSVYPLPAKNTITVEIQSSKTAKANVTVTDVLGKTIFSNIISLVSGLNQTLINVQALKGHYFLKVITDGFTETRKITVIN